MINKLGDEPLFGIVADPDRTTAASSIEAAVKILQQPDSPGDLDNYLPILLMRKNDDASRRAITRRVHDIRGALRTLTLAVGSVKEGYRFDDQMADAKLNAITKAVAVLEKESQLTVALLTTP